MPDSAFLAAEAAIVDALRRAIERDHQDVPVAALTGVDDLLALVTDDTLRQEMSTLSEDEATYASELARAVAQMCREWYLENGTARSYATAASTGRILKGQQEALSILKQHFAAPGPERLDAAVETLERRLDEAGWGWAPARTGDLRGLDGFMTPADEAGVLLPIQIPVRLVSGRCRGGSRGEVLGPFIYRDDVELLRAHIPGGYFIVYSNQDGSLYFAKAERAAERFARGTKERDHVRMMPSDLLTALTLETIGRGAWEDRKRLVDALRGPAPRDTALRLYQNLCSVHHVFFEFLATLAFVDPGNLLLVHNEWAHSLATGDGDVEVYLGEVVSTIGEYEVGPPVGLLQGFLAQSLMLTAMRAVIDGLDEISYGLEEDQAELIEQLGVPGLRATVASAIERSFRTPGGARLPVNTPECEEASWVIVNTGHYYMSVASVALVVDRLVHNLREVVLPPAEGSMRMSPSPIWIRYRSSPASVA